MTNHAWSLLGLYLVLLLLSVWPLGRYIAAVMEGRVRWLRALERAIYRLCAVDPGQEQGWLQYALSVLVFSCLGTLALYAVQRLQVRLPLNPEHLANVSPDSALNTAISFVTNTNWQGYAGESTMGYLTQMLGLTVQNFLSAAVGIAVAMALIRGFTRHGALSIGNAWVDLTRVTLYVLLPLSLAFALVLAGQGVIQNLAPYQAVQALEAGAQPVPSTQTLAMGPVASQEAIKMVGTNGGGFFNANSAHPFENPTPLTNLLQMLAIFLIPAALTATLGHLTGDARQGWALLAAMAIPFVAAAVLAISAEQQGNPILTGAGADLNIGVAHDSQPGGNMEGKEARFGIADSALFATITTAASCGAVNAMHDSFTPLGGLVPLVLIQLGEVVFGGVGSGLYGLLLFAILAVFVAGLMIGRTPEYLGKKIGPFEMKMTAIAVLVTPLLALVGTAIALMTDAGRAGISNPGPQGFTEVLYAFSSAANNNGSAFAGLSANTPFYNVLLGVIMWFGRFGVIVPVLAIAGALAAKQRIPVTAGTLPTHGPLFVGLLIGTVLLVGLLNYVPGLALGPVVEHLLLWTGSFGGAQ
ncbi:potassium-transporting ATPase subunit KdpA [uncultured Thiodictyon sp.]|uniref:potassium-transporting ATPase subunit KdpA n=1 Tax=uncultured Thiodictyon sp. TaxID=1846217 RepID=UPI0025FC52A1|nr:potassium-transporting ATPase subunit KdpA [uncultured Thiodictyon sp.]